MRIFHLPSNHVIEEPRSPRTWFDDRLILTMDYPRNKIDNSPLHPDENKCLEVIISNSLHAQNLCAVQPCTYGYG